MIVVFDLDGTLANIEHRLHHIRTQPKNWGAFFRACTHDTPVDTVIQVCHALRSAGHRIEVWSGRSDEVRRQTEEWLAAAGVEYEILRMRRAGDKRQDSIVKGQWFDRLPPAARPVLAFDDRQQVVDMWRSRGVLCCQVAPGDF